MAEKELSRKAVIDLGTNTFNLLIAEIDANRLTYIYSEKVAVLLGMGGINEGYIAEEAMQRAKEALTQFKLICNEKEVDSIQGVGTSALRVAKNGKELIDFAQGDLQIPITIVSGLDEAKLIYKGVSYCHPIHYPTIIMDIGGGSTEFIHADSSGFISAISKDIGVSRIYQLLEQPEEYTEEHIQFILDYLNQQKCTFFESSKSSILVGSSGSFETVFEMIHKMNFPTTGDSFELPLQQVIEQLNWLISSTLEERMNNEWIVSIRKKMMPIAALKMKWIIETVNIERIYVSPYSLKEGVFISDLAR